MAAEHFTVVIAPTIVVPHLPEREPGTGSMIHCQGTKHGHLDHPSILISPQLWRLVERGMSIWDALDYLADSDPDYLDIGGEA